MLEQVLAQDLDRLEIPYEREFRFSPDRMWRADFYIEDSPILVEVEGGAGTGRHSRREGFLNDAKKYAAAARLGYTVLRFTAPQVTGMSEIGTESEAIETIKIALKYWGGEE